MDLKDATSYATLSAIAPLPTAKPERLSDLILVWADRYRKLVFAGIFALFMLGFNAQWRVERDSALYLSLARNLSQGLGFTYRGIHHSLAYPGLPILFDGIFVLFHTQSVAPLLICMLLLGFAGLGLTYRLVLLHSDRPTAVIVTAGLGMTRLYYRYSFELLSDLPFLIGVLAFLVGYESVFFAGRRNPNHRVRWFDWVFLIGGLGMAISMRPVMLLLLVAIIIAMIWSTARGDLNRIPAISTGVAILAAAFLFYWMVRFGRNHGTASVGGYEDFLLDVKFAKPLVLLKQVFGQNIPALMESAAVKALFGAPYCVGINTLASLVVIYLCFELLRDRILWGVWAVLTVVMLCLFKPLDRYFLPVIPLLVFAWWQVLYRLNHRLSYRWGDKVFLALLLLGGATNVLRLSQMVAFEQRRTPFLEHYRDGCYASMNPAAELLRANVGSRDWVMVEPKCARILTYLSSRYALEKGDNVKLGPKQPAFALEGYFDETRSPAGKMMHSSTLEAELNKRHLKLGAPVGRPIQGRDDYEPWILYRVERIN
jgi:hypothetical protein